MDKLFKTFGKLIKSNSIDDCKIIASKAMAPKLRAVFEKFNFKLAAKLIEKWFIELVNNKPPSKKIKGLYFGIFETTSGCELYVIGSNEYNEEDSDWACNFDWRPKGRYSNINIFADLWNSTKPMTDDNWRIVLAAIIISLKEFLRKESVLKILKNQDMKFATGFDGGDLFILNP